VYSLVVPNQFSLDEALESRYDVFFRGPAAAGQLRLRLERCWVFLLERALRWVGFGWGAKGGKRLVKLQAKVARRWHMVMGEG